MTDPVLLELLANRAKRKAWQRAKEFPAQRIAELSGDDRLLVGRARRLERFLTTPFFAAEQFTHRAGKHVTIDQTIAGCGAILDGKLDDVPEEALLYIGAIEEAMG